MSRVTEIRYVGYAVPDMAAERAFYRDAWKLKEVADRDGMIFFAAEGSEEPYVVRLRENGANRIDVIAMATDTRADVDALHDKVVAAGCQIIASPHDLTSLGGGYGFRFFSVDGLPFEISADVARGEKREIERWEGVPQKISHVVLHSPDHKAMVRFFIDVLGFKLSDWVGEYMAFLRCNEWHHRIALVPGPATLNHVAYDMLSVDCMMRGMARMKEWEFNVAWGPGRHTAGNNTFSYFVTPNGNMVEFTSELETVDFEHHEAKVHTPSARTVDQWGIAQGSPETMPKPAEDPGLFQAVAY
ncbi:oxidoreductase [Sphingomonas sp. TF3]|uniref:VOC family protein n=1 Tax=Sphingomonas sp. TF3 TaxID=2495580 RepID=UPI000F88355A|nr:VOC family protein [Sphingomonas sp. TF3]RUN74619.1 oxidoreductase [Sphingomonas sp. TF3]